MDYITITVVLDTLEKRLDWIRELKAAIVAAKNYDPSLPDPLEGYDNLATIDKYLAGEEWMYRINGKMSFNTVEDRNRWRALMHDKIKYLRNQFAALPSPVGGCIDISNPTPEYIESGELDGEGSPILVLNPTPGRQTIVRFD